MNYNSSIKKHAKNLFNVLKLFSIRILLKNFTVGMIYPDRLGKDLFIYYCMYFN